MAGPLQIPSGDDVPSILQSVQSGRPFATCVDCGTALLEGAIPYAVEKVVRNGEVVFEYAICVECTDRQMKAFSEESLARILEYLKKSAEDFESRHLEVFLAALGDPTLRNEQILALGRPADHCHRCGRAGGGFLDEHTVMGILAGRRLATGLITLCSGCTEGADELLSRKTREAHEDFIRTRFPGVPAGIDLPAGLLAL